MDTLFYRSPRIFALAVGVAVVMGLSALLTIGRQEDPTITNLFATVVTPYPGASPARVEALVTEKIEEELRGIPEIAEINSTSSTGISVVSIELSQFISEQRIEQAWSEIRDALADAARAFPEGVPEPTFDDDRTGAFTAISAIQGRGGAEVSPAILRRYAEDLQDRLRRVPETRLVRLFGAGQEEVRVTLDAVRLASLGLSAEAASAAIARADAKVRAGQVRGERSDLLIEVEGEIRDLQRIREIPVGTGPGGAVVRVADVATVERAVREPAASIAYADGARAVLVAARMENDRQVDAWMSSVRGALAEFEAQLPAGLEHRLLFDQSAYTADRLTEVGWNMATGVALVVAVLFLTLGWRSALVVAAVIPLAALISVAAMQRVGIPIHQMSVTGLIVALGLLVDAAIVMADEVKRRLQAGGPASEAVRASVRRLTVPLLASTATTVFAFMPMAMLPGPAGDFVGSIAMSVIIMLVASLVLALTVAPALSGWMLGGTADRRRGPVGRLLEDGLSPAWLGRLFGATIRLSLRHKGLSILAGLALPVMGFAAFPTLTAQFFPGVERDQFYVQVLMPPGSSIAETERTALAAGRIVAAEPGVRSVHWVIGESAPSFYYNMQMNRDGARGFAEALVTTSDPAATDAAVPSLQAKLDAVVPGAQVIVRDLVQGPPVAAPIELRIVGPDLAVIRELGERTREILAGVPSVTHTRAGLVGGEPKLVFRLDEDAVRRAGLDLASAARQLEAMLEGATGGSLVEATEELPVRVRVGGAGRADAAAVRSVDLVPPDAASRAAEGAYPGIPLTALGSWEVVPSESPISRRNGERINLVQGYLGMGVLPEEALQVFQRRLAEAAIALPPGVRLEFGGDSDARAETVRNLVSTLGLVVVLMAATIVLTFRSYRLSLVAVLVCGLSMGLSFLALAIGGYPFGIQALIGAIGSIGVSVNAAIIVMTALQEDEDAMAGDLDAMHRVVTQSARHIVSTTVTTVGGFLPLILAGGGFWPPFAVAIAGGVALSAVVSFYFTPPMFALLMRPRRRTPDAVPAPEPAPPPAMRVAAE